jgi:hypothetical protein
MLSQRGLGVVGCVIYDGYPSPHANETCDPKQPLSSEGCAVAAAYNPRMKTDELANGYHHFEVASGGPCTPIRPALKNDDVREDPSSLGLVPGYSCSCCKPAKTPECVHPCDCFPPPPPLPPPMLSCAVRQRYLGANASGPCPVPQWDHTWDLARSTAIQPCNVSGWYDPAFAAKWGLVSFDWSNAKADWLAATPHDCEERLAEQCRKVKAINPRTKCFVYRNTELALEWLSSQRAVMDEQHAGWFVRFQSDSAATADAKCEAAGPCNKDNGICCPFGNVMCQMQLPWRGERQFAWNFTNSSLRSWWIKNILVGGGANDADIDGSFSDDVIGFPAEQENWIPRLGYSPAQLHALQVATQETWQQAAVQLADNGGYNWQMFGKGDGPRGAGIAKAECVEQMRVLCTREMQSRPMMTSAGGGPNFEEFNQTVSCFTCRRKVPYYSLIIGPLIKLPIQLSI